MPPKIISPLSPSFMQTPTTYQLSPPSPTVSSSMTNPSPSLTNPSPSLTNPSPSLTNPLTSIPSLASSFPMVKNTTVTPAFARQSKMLSINFSEDTSCFVVGTTDGFRVYNTDPYQERFYRQMTGGVQLAEIYGRTNIVFLVGKSGSRSIGLPNHLLIWDDRQGRTVKELTFNTSIIKLFCRGGRLIVVESAKISMFLISNMSLMKSWITGFNPHGLAAMNHPEAEFPLIAFPATKSQPDQPGYLQLEYLKEGKTSLTIDQAHASPLSQIALTQNGRLIATSSERGTLIRIWCSSQGTKLRELRRGLQAATIQSLVLHPSGRALVVSSSSGTIHVYSLATRMSVEDDYNRRSSLAFLSGMLPKYFSSEWSMISFSAFTDVGQPQQIQCTFGSQEPGTLIVVGDAGYYEKYRYTTQEHRLLNQRKIMPNEPIHP